MCASADGNLLPFLEATFDLVICHHSLEHVARFEATVEEPHVNACMACGTGCGVACIIPTAPMFYRCASCSQLNVFFH